MFGEEMVESIEMPSFLIIHMSHQRPHMGMCGYNGRGLGSIDEGSC